MLGVVCHNIRVRGDRRFCNLGLAKHLTFTQSFFWRRPAKKISRGGSLGVDPLFPAQVQNVHHRHQPRPSPLCPGSPMLFKREFAVSLLSLWPFSKVPSRLFCTAASTRRTTPPQEQVESPSSLLPLRRWWVVITPPAGPGGAITPVINPNNNRMVNTSFNENLFGSYKISSIKCKALRDRITQGSLVALPRSKVDSSKPMCLAWHTKGQCNANCPCASDHFQYSAPEFAPLATWCVIGYAPPAQTA